MRSIIITLLALSACDTRTSYYDEEGLVQVDGLSVESEEGNIGGQSLEITGSGFGVDPNAVTVMFGHQNATVLSVEDTLLTVQVPHGPLYGGPVDIRVGTADGQDTLLGAYSYNIPGNGMEPVYGTADSSNQIAYISVANDMMSCYGGTATGEEYGCQTFALSGDAGIEGRSEVLEIVYPNAEAPYALGKGGFSNAMSISWGAWNVTNDTHDIVSVDDENNVQDFRLNIGEFALENLSTSGGWCANLPSMANFTYTGEADYAPSSTNPVTGGLIYPELEEAGYKYSSVTIGGTGDLTTSYGGSSGCYTGGRQYDLNELKFCMTDEYEEGETLSYEPEWPIGWNFFQANDANGQLSPEVPIPVRVDIPEADVDQDLYLPPYAKFSDDALGGEDLWALTNITAECPDTDDDRVTTSADNVYNWTWEPVDWDDKCTANSEGVLVSEREKGVCVPEGVKGINSYVTASVSFLAFSWMGGEGITQAASISVPDINNFDEETGLSSMGLPTWVLYSFPSSEDDYGEAQGQFGDTTWQGYAAFDGNNYGLLVITIDRIVEYTLEASVETSIGGIEETVDGDLVFSYSTGDMGYFTFDNPLDAIDQCGDCLDNDGDGWLDGLDPDCISGTEETFVTTDSTCNNGLDDDGDGLIDAEDENCVDGSAGESEDCSNNIDDDQDGWTDQDDPDCQDGGVFEDSPVSEYTCNNGLDDDGDGWIDSDDLACTVATQAEDDGFVDADGDGISDYGCNNGVDDDGNGDIDSEDIYCARRGPDEEEVPTDSEGNPSFAGICADDIDNDEDGYIDEADPACEITNGNSEYPALYDNTDERYAALGDCNDGIDNDCDGNIDSEDAGCTNAYSYSEADDGSTSGCNCDDGEDNDGDGWFDQDDIDCNGSAFGTESGLVDADEDGTPDYACNNGIDDDADGLTDAFDVYCWERVGPDGDSEVPSFLAGGACDNGTDDDSDGYIDFADPGCDKTNGGSEAGSIDLAHWGDPTCFDGTDNDGDGEVDSTDPDCTAWHQNE